MRHFPRFVRILTLHLATNRVEALLPRTHDGKILAYYGRQVTQGLGYLLFIRTRVRGEREGGGRQPEVPFCLR